MTECAGAVESAHELGLAHYISFALTQVGRTAALAGDLPQAEAALVEAIDTAERAGAGWFAAFARVALAGVRRAQGDPSAADALLRQVVEWSHGPIAGAGRVTFFRRLGGDPVAMAAAQLDPATQPT
jgi:hypothetical protein